MARAEAKDFLAEESGRAGLRVEYTQETVRGFSAVLQQGAEDGQLQQLFFQEFRRGIRDSQS